ncbi:XdhC family protein [Antarctobacter jejuensis]|uniref:XdhC family protein n=1 Tax=Antarctobacter jejuensis TaxID=1439938 RepID=UPI003FD0E8EA
MSSFDIFDCIEDLRRQGRPFCVATVIRTAEVTSAKAGAKAAVTIGGEVQGHLGGACVTRAVREAAVEALREGEARVIRVKPSARVVNLTDDDGAQVYRSGCPSGGTVDLLIEPFELPPRLVILGETPIAEALAGHGALAGYRVLRDTSDAELTARDFVVVASQGVKDGDRLLAALESGARRVSMVASRKKAGVLAQRLLDQGVSPDRVARLKAPAGLDIGAVDPQEIALSIMAEIVAWRRADRAVPVDGEEVSTRGHLGG